MRLIASAIVVAGVIAGALVAASIALTRHYSVASTANAATVFRMNNWTGEVVLCWAQITPKGGVGPLVTCRNWVTAAEVGLSDKEVGLSDKDDWVKVPNSAQTDQAWPGVRVPETKTK